MATKKNNNDVFSIPQKTILYIGSFKLPDGNAAAHRVINTSKAFLKLGYKVVFIGIRNEKQNSTSLILKKYDNFEFYEVNPPTSLKEWFSYLTSIDSIKIVIDKIGMKNLHSIITYNYPSVAFYKLSKFCKRNDIKLISDLTEWYRYRLNAKGGNLFYILIKNMDSEIRMRYMSFKSDGIIAISRYLNKYYSKRKITVLIPPLVDLNEKKWTQSQIGLDSIKEITSIGMPNHNKESLADFIKILADLSKDFQFRLNIIGVKKERVEFLNPELNDSIQKLGDRIKFWGRLSNAECIGKMSKSHYFIFLRQNTIVTKAGFSTKFVESISSGCPVLTNNTSNITDYLRNGVNGFILETNDTSKLKAQIISALNVPNHKIEKMKKECRNSRLFHYENYTNQLQHFFENIENS